MTLSFNAIVLFLLFVYGLWMGYSEHRKETASTKSLSEAQKRRFDEAYSFGRPNDEYPDDLRAHAATAQRARIRKGAALVIVIGVPLLLLFRGI